MARSGGIWVCSLAALRTHLRFGAYGLPALNEWITRWREVR